VGGTVWPKVVGALALGVLTTGCVAGSTSGPVPVPGRADVPVPHSAGLPLRDVPSGMSLPCGISRPEPRSARPYPMPRVEPRCPGPVPMPEVAPRRPGPVPMPDGTPDDPTWRLPDRLRIP